MKKILLKSMMLLCLLFVGMGAWAETRTENFSSSAATSDNYNCASSLSTATNRSDFNYTWTPSGSGTVFKNGIKLGSGSATGSVTSSNILADISAGTQITVKVYAAVWNTDDGKITVTYNGSSTTNDAANPAITTTTGSYSSSAFTSSTNFNITKVAGKDDLTIASSSKRILIDKVVVVFEDAADTRTAINMTAFTAAETTIVKGNTTNTTVTNDQNGWTPAYTYTSSNTSVATVNASGVITAVAKGTATITASLSIPNDDTTWKKGSTSSMNVNVAVVNPQHSAHFSVNGTINAGDDCVAREDDAITFPSDPVDINGKKFQGWKKGSAIDGTTNDAPTFVNTSNETMGTNDVVYYAVFATMTDRIENVSYGWETAMDGNVWTKNNLSDGAYYPTYKHSGSYAATNGSTTTAYIQTKNKIANPTSATCYYTKASSNTNNTSKFIIQVSTNGTSWTNVSTGKTMDQVTQGTFEELSADLSSYSNVLVRFYYTGTTASRVIDDVSVSYANITYSDYCTTVAAPVYSEQSLTLAATDGYYYYATFSSSSVTFWPNMDGDLEYATEVAKVSVDGSALTITNLDEEEGYDDLEGFFVPANTGVLVMVDFDKAEKTVPYYTVTNKNVAALEGNALVAGTGSTPTDGAEFKYYKLAYDAENDSDLSTLGFYWGANDGAPFALTVGKAYLKVAMTDGVKGFRFGGNTTGIKTLSNEQSANKAVKRIVNGKLVIEKAGKMYNAAGAEMK